MKILIIGLDGATYQIIKPLIAKNKLLFFQKLIQQGAYANLTSTLPTNSAASWASFFTGKNPGKHNIYDFLSNKHLSSSPQLIHNKSIKARRLWDFTNHHSLKTILFNIPIIAEPEPINGIMVSGILTPRNKPYAYPLTVFEELQRQNYITDCGPPRITEPEIYSETLLKTFEKQISIFHQKIQSHPWDLAVFTSNVLDRAQKYFWEDTEKIESIYMTIDSYLQTLFESIDDETYFIVLSNYGFNSVNKKFFVNEWLYELGLQQRKITTQKPFINDIDDFIYNHSNNGQPFVSELLSKTGITKSNIRSVLPSTISESLKKIIPHSVKRLFHREYLQIQWKKTQAYFVSEHLQGIYINLKGREPYGIVEPGKEYEKLRDQIISELYHLKDPYTFEEVIEDAFRKEDVFSGNYLDDAPDIVIIPRKNKYYLDPYKRTSRLFIGSSNDEYPVYAQRERNGVFFINGPNIRLGMPISNVNIYDLLPTILGLFGIPYSAEDLDGKPISEIYSENVSEKLFSHPTFIPAQEITSFIMDEYFREKPNVNSF